MQPRPNPWRFELRKSLPLLAISGLFVIDCSGGGGSRGPAGLLNSAVATQQLELNVVGSGTGNISWSDSDGPHTCTPGPCFAPIPNATTVTLTANASGTSTFAGWIGDCSGTSPTCAVLLDQSRTTAAAFSASGLPPLIIDTIGRGSVTGSGYACGTAAGPCAMEFAPSTPIALTATPDPGQTFLGWAGTGAGTCTGTNASCTVTKGTAAESLRALFSGAFLRLDVVLTGSGSGGVTSSVGGISCGNIAGGGGMCAASFTPNTVVTLTATPVGTSTATWYGDCAGTPGNATCTVTMDRVRSVRMAFELSGPSAADAGTDATNADAGTDASAADTSVPAGPLAENAVDPIAQPPNGQSLAADDKASSPSIVRDANPAGSGDLVGLFMAGANYYLLVSTDDGASWQYMPASGGAPPASGMTLPATAIAQDTLNFRVHWVSFPSGAPNALYHRIALTYALGHVSGWQWEASDQPGPAFDASAGTELAPRIALAEMIDGAGAHLLALVGVDQPSSTEPRRLVAARTVAGARALAPSGAADWGKVTDGTAGFSVLGAWSTAGAGPDPAALVNTANADPLVREHNSTLTLVQLPADGSLHVFTGTMYYNDTDNHGDITRWRLSRSGSSWAFDAAASGVTVAPANANVRPCLGNAVATANYVWVTWGDANGVHVGRLAASGAWTADALASPDGSQNVWWYSALNVAANERDAWLMWEKNNGTVAVDSAGHWDGSAWSTRDDSALFARNPSWVGGASTWTVVGNRPQGIGVMAYGYADWGKTPLHFSAHVMPQ